MDAARTFVLRGAVALAFVVMASLTGCTPENITGPEITVSDGDGHNNVASDGDGHNNVASDGDGHNNVASDGDGHNE